MEFITNQKGGRKLCYQGYMYTLKEVTNTSTRWECSSRKALGCPGKIRTDINNPELVLSVTLHRNHEPSQTKINVASTKQKIKKDLVETAAVGGSTHQTLCRNLSALTREERLEFGNPQSAKRSFNRCIAKGRPRDPAELHDLIIEGRWLQDIDGNDFMFYDNLNDNNRIVVFGTDQCLVHLANSDIWHMDGTFKVCPTLFKQLYVIRTPLDESAISVVYAFMTNKSEASYIELLNIICNKCRNMGVVVDPTVVIMDFEQSMMNALRNVFGPHLQLKGCFFHLCQSTWRHIQGIGLADEYKADDDIKLWCGMLDALAFLPENQVAAGIQVIRNNTPRGFEDLVSYFDSTYVSGTFRAIARPGQNVILRNIPPRYPPATWNMNETTLRDGSRTNNLCESWNNSFIQLVGHHHPSIWTCIEALQKDNMLSSLAFKTMIEVFR